MSRKFDRPRSWLQSGNDNRTFLSFNLIRQLLIESIRRGNGLKIHVFQAIENVLSIGKKYPINTHANEPFNYECWCKPPNGSLPSSYDNINWTALDQKTCQVSWTSTSNYSLAEITDYSDTLILRLTRYSVISLMRMSLTFFQSYNGTLVGDGCNLPHYIPDVFLMSIILFMGTFLLSVELKDFKNALFFPSKVVLHGLVAWKSS